MLKYLNILRAAFVAIARNKMRSFLTALGIIIGTASVIIMLAIGQGAESSIKDQIAAMGTNVIIVFPGSSQQGGVRQGAGSNTTLTEEDAKAIVSECPSVGFVSPGAFGGGQLIFGNQNWSARIEGTGDSYPEIRSWKQDYGAFYTEADIKSASKVCVIGKTVADNLFQGQDPVNQTIRVRNVPFKVLGVLAVKGQNAMGMDQDDIVLMPYTTVMKRLARSSNIRQILISAVSEAKISSAVEEISQLLRTRHKIYDGQEDDFMVRTQEEIASAASATTRILTILLAGIASVSLIVGGIGIMNIMLVSVTERTREIGIRMSVGAKEKDILIQFLVEATVLSIIGGLVGIGIGISGSQLISKFAGWPAVVSGFSIVISFGFCFVTGIFFGYYPARKAASLNPIEALRYE